MKNRQTRRAAWPDLPLECTPGVPPAALFSADANEKRKTVIIVTNELEPEEAIRRLFPGSGTVRQ